MPSPTKEQLLELADDIGTDRMDSVFWDRIDEDKLYHASVYLLGLLDSLYENDPDAFTSDQFRDFYDRLGLSPRERNKIRQDTPV